MGDVLLWTVLVIGLVFLVLTLFIVSNKAWRESRDRFQRSRRRDLEPLLLSYAHGDDSLLPALRRRIGRRDAALVENVLLSHAQSVRGIERDRFARALDELGYVDRYLAGLRSGRWWRRARSAERLGIAHATRSANALVRVLDDPSAEVRIRAASALGKIGGTAAVKPLIQALDEPNRWSTIRVADILTGMGQRVLEDLVTAFPSLRVHGKVAALDVLGRVHSLQVAGWLRVRLRDDHRDVRARACHALGAIGDTEAGPALTEALRDPEWPVRAMAAKALGRIRFAGAVPALTAAVRDRAWWARTNAAEALRHMGPAGVEALQDLLGDRDLYAGHQAVVMLHESGALAQQAELLALPVGREREAAESVLRRLIRLGRLGALSELQETHPDLRVRARLSELLAEELREQEGRA